MLKYLKEFEKYVEISGFNEISIGDVKAFWETVCKDLSSGVEVQLFDADLIATWQHLYFAVLDSLVAFRSQRNLCKSIALETALYASAQRQIRKALDQIGLKPQSSRIAVVVIAHDEESARDGLYAVAKHLGVKPNEEVLDLTDAKIRQIRKTFNITEEELEATLNTRNKDKALVDLVIERVALLSTRL